MNIADAPGLDAARAAIKHGELTAGAGIALELMADAVRAGDAAALARAQLVAATISRLRSRLDEAWRLADQAREYFRAVGDRPHCAEAEMELGHVALFSGDVAGALLQFGEARQQAEGLPESELSERLERSIGMTYLRLGRFDEAQAHYDRSLAQRRRRGDAAAVAEALNGMAVLHLRRTEGMPAGAPERNALVRRALALLDEADALCRTTDAARVHAQIAGNRAGIHALLGDPARTVREYEDAIRAFRAVESPLNVCNAYLNLCPALAELGRHDEALRACHDGLDLARQHALRVAERDLLRWLVDEAKRRGDTAAALEHFQRFHDLDRELGNEQALVRAELLGVRLELERLRGQQARLQQEALVDPLTGVANRRRLDQWLADPDAHLPDDMVAIAMIDLDHFKRINDRWSHEVGDRVLKKVADIARAVLREDDQFARFGGEEFVASLPVQAPEEATAVCERLRRAVREHDWSATAGGLGVTVSIGVAVGRGVGAQELLRRADEQLYAAKNSGRDRVSTVVVVPEAAGNPSRPERAPAP